MKMTYELWDADTSNVMAAFDTEDAALAVVRESVVVYGEAYADSLALLREDDDERVEAVAAGAALGATGRLTLGGLSRDVCPSGRYYSQHTGCGGIEP